jgi:DNA-directed RNA polymerase I, II, and III subunit RPABC2
MTDIADDFDDISDVSSNDELVSEDDTELDEEEQIPDQDTLQILEPDDDEDDFEDEEENLDDIEEEFTINISENHRFEIVSRDKTYEKMFSKKKETSPFMSRFEVTKLIGIRAQQLSCGMDPCVSFDPDIKNTEFIAIQELLQKKMPLIVRRYLPNGVYEDWKVDELIIPDSILY